MRDEPLDVDEPSDSTVLAGPGQEALFKKLWGALRAGDVPALREALAAGADPSWKSRTNKEPLIHASWHASSSAVAALLAAGADPNVSSDSGWSALHGAARGGKHETMAMLLRAGARPDGSGVRDQGTPLFYAFIGQEDSPGDNAACAALLVGAGADIHARDWAGLTALHRMMERACVEGCLALIRAGASLDARMSVHPGSGDMLGMTALENALRPSAETGRLAPSDERVAACARESVALAEFLAIGEAVGNPVGASRGPPRV